MPYPVIVYLDIKNKCSRKLNAYLRKHDYPFSQLPFDAVDSKAAFKYHGHMGATAPVLQIGKMLFYGERLFDSTTMKLNPVVKKCLKEHVLPVKVTEMEAW